MTTQIILDAAPPPPERFDTERLLIRRANPGDAENLFRAYASDPAVARYMTWRAHPDARATRAFLEEFDRLWSSREKFLYALQGHEGSPPFGIVEIRPDGPDYELGYALSRAYWGRGLMPEAVAALVGWCMGQPGVRRVSATCDIDNLASARVLEKAGLSFLGVLPRHIVHPNIESEPRHSRLYALYNATAR